MRLGQGSDGGGGEIPPPRWARRLVAASLRAWPAAARARDGAALMDAVHDHLAAAARRGRLRAAGVVLGECAAVLTAGLRLRMHGMVWGAGRAGTGAGRVPMGWTAEAGLAARTLRRSPGFTAVAVGTLALGIGANAAVFGLVDRVLLRPPPYEAPDELVLLWRTLGPSGDRLPVPAPDAAAVEERASSLAGLAFVGRTTDGTLAAGADETPEHIVIAGVTPDFFDVLGVGVARGRGFAGEDGADPSPGPAEGTPPPGVLLSDAAWRRVFAGDPSLPGRTVRLNGRPVVVLGVVPARFRLELPPFAGVGTGVDLWVPLRTPLSAIARQDGRLVDQDTDNTGAVLARRAGGATDTRVREELDRIAAELRREVPGYAAAGYGLMARPLHADATAHVRGLLLALLAGAGGVLLVACLSVSALLLARGLAREGELAVRAALGASRWRLMRHLLAESLVILAAGGALALLVAWEGGRALAALAPPDMAGFDLRPGWRPLAFVAAATLGAAFLFAVIAALQAGPLSASRRAGALLPRGRFRRGRAREVLVVGEVAVSLALVLGAGLLVRTARELRAVQPGFRPEGALGFDVSVRVAGAYGGPAERAHLVRALEEAVAAVPGVRAVGLTGALPLSGRRWAQPWGMPGQAPSEWATERADFRTVTSGYFEAAGTRLLEGRTFTADEDLDERQRVVVVDEALARRIAPEGSAVGASVGIPLDGAPVEARVVGVVEGVRHDDLATPGRGTIYVPYRQEASRDVAFVARTTGDPADLAPAVRRALYGVEPGLGVYGMRALTDYVDAELAPTRFGVTLLGAYAALVLLAVSLGLYGVVAWEVGRRTRDLGVRMAVGASGARVRATVLAGGLRLAALGTLLGTVLAGLTVGALRPLVYGVAVTDPLSWGAAVAVVFAVTLLASWFPAARAARLDPSGALRSE